MGDLLGETILVPTVDDFGESCDVVIELTADASLVPELSNSVGRDAAFGSKVPSEPLNTSTAAERRPAPASMAAMYGSKSAAPMFADGGALSKEGIAV
jgi:hypothetical protein